VPERRWSGRRIALLALLALVLAGSALLWSARKPIARSYVDTLLAKNGVPAQYEITHFGFRTQRLEHVLIGDTADPDLTADWVEIGFGLSGVSPSLRTIRAKGVRVRGRLVDGRVSFGALDRLLPKPSNAPFFLPDIDVASIRQEIAAISGHLPVIILTDSREPLRHLNPACVLHKPITPGDVVNAVRRCIAESRI